MQALHNLSKDSLIALVRELQGRLDASSGPDRHRIPGVATTTSRDDPNALDLDFIACQALKVLDNSGIPAVIYDTEGELQLLAANSAMSTASGYGQRQLETMRLIDLLVPEDRDRLRRLLRLPRQGGFSSAGGWRHLTRDGEVRQIEVSGYDLIFQHRRARFVILQDVTKRARDQLIQQRLAAIVETSQDAILSRTIDGTVLSWNRAAEHLFGYSAAEIVGRSIDLLLPPESRDAERDLIRGRIHAGQPVESYETTRLHKDGTRIEVAVSVAPLRGPDGRIIGASSIIRDVRAAKAAERELARSHERLGALAQLSYDWCWEQDETLRFTYHSLEWSQYRDLTRKSVIGHTRFELPVTWQSEHQRDAHAQDLAQRRAFKDLHYRILDSVGCEHHVTVSGEPIFDAAGEFRGYRGIGRDVSRQKREESSLELYRAIVGSTDEAIFSWSDSGIVLSWNAGAEAMLGYNAEEIVGKPVSILLSPQLGSEMDETSAKALAGEHVLNQETARRHKNGTIIQVSVTCSPIRDDRGQVTAVCCIARDIRKDKLQERLIGESYQRLKAALESAALCLWDWDVPAGRVFYSEEFAALLKMSPGELPQDDSPCQHLAHPDDAASLNARLQAHLRDESESFEFEFRVRARDDEWKWVIARGRLVSRDRDGNPLRMLGTAQDITSRRRGESALRESEARFRSLVEASTQAVWITDARGEVVSDLASWQRYTGLSSEQTRGEGWTAAVHPEDRARVLQRWREACQSGELFDIECRVRRFDGTWRHMHSRAVPVRNEDGSVREWIGMNADISKRKEAEAARSLLAGVVESSHDAIISHNLDGVILSWNRGAEEMFGYRPEEAIGRDYRFLTPQSDPQDLAEIRATIERGARIPDLEILCRHQDGHEVPVSVSLAGLRDEAGRIVGVTAVARDISAQRMAARALRESEGQLVSILNNAAEGMIVVAADGAIERFNLVAQRMFGYDAEEACRMNLRQLTIELGGAEPRLTESRAVSSAEGASDLETGWIRLLLGSRREVTGRRDDASIFPLEIALSEIATASSTTKFIAVVRDITERKSWEKRIYTLAYSDSLTGLPNRLLLRDRLEHAIATAQRNGTLVGVLFFDLDHFKAINDSYGHHVGDVLLRELGERAKSCVREIDTVCRLGGDEFVLVLPELREAADAGAVARKILLALSQPYHIEERDLVITPTVGISIFPRDGVDADTLLRNADTAMYHAKESGKNNFRFYDSERAS